MQSSYTSTINMIVPIQLHTDSTSLVRVGKGHTHREENILQRHYMGP